MDYLLKTSEIILKGKNRKFFEKILKENIKFKLGNNLEFIKNLGGTFWVKTKIEALNELKKIFGLSKILEVKIFENLEDVFKNLDLKDYQDYSLKVKRSTKDYPLNSLQIKKRLKDFIKNKFNLEENKNSKNKIYLEYRNKKFFLSLKEENAFGGLPLKSSGKGLVLLSAGFDSPVASFLSMKRGLKIYFVHFHSYPQTSINSIEKVKEIVKLLNEYNLGSELYLINILEIQKFYYFNVPKEYLVIFYRRTMYRLAEKLKNELNLDCLITGENLGQVASQTIQNLFVIEKAINSLVLRPLIGFNKQEIIDLAKIIKTEEISKKPYEDCCNLFLPKKVKTKANLEIVEKIEKNIAKELFKLEEKAYQEKEKYIFLIYNKL